MRPTFVAAVVFACLFPGRALVQHYYTAEELRDLARPVTPGAAALALGGTRGSGLGDATDAAFNPATLVLGPRADAVVSIGAYRYSRDELQRTSTGRSFEDRTIAVDGRTRPIGSAAVAWRWSRFAVGATYDAISRLDYARDVDRLRFQNANQILADTRQWSLAVRHDRLGGAFGAVLPGGSAAAGIEVHASRAHIRYEGGGIFTQSYYNDRLQAYQPDSIIENSASLDSDAWNPGVTLGAMMRPHPRVDVSVRYVHEPSESIVLNGTTLTYRADFPAGKGMVINETRSSVNPPDLVSGGATLRFGDLRIVGEAGAVLARDTFHDDEVQKDVFCNAGASETVVPPPPPAIFASRFVYPCWTLRAPAFARPVEVRNGADLRVGVERGWHHADLSWWLRGGVSHETSAVLQPLDDSEDLFMPPQPGRTWLHAGGGVRIGRVVTDVGLAAWERQYRVMVDVKMATGGGSRSVYGSRH